MSRVLSLFINKVRGVVNLCEEYSGPIRQYEKLGISHLRLPTVDHFESSVEDLERAVTFIRKHKDDGSKVYVHCRAGHGRSAAVVFAWLMSKDPQADLLALNQWLGLLRNVRRTLWKQKNILNFHARLLKQQGACPDEE
jgi:atypical dual specificity phosphatase